MNYISIKPFLKKKLEYCQTNINYFSTPLIRKLISASDLRIRHSLFFVVLLACFALVNRFFRMLGVKKLQFKVGFRLCYVEITYQEIITFYKLLCFLSFNCLKFLQWERKSSNLSNHLFCTEAHWKYVDKEKKIEKKKTNV